MQRIEAAGRWAMVILFVLGLGALAPQAQGRPAP